MLEPWFDTRNWGAVVPLIPCRGEQTGTANGTHDCRVKTACWNGGHTCGSDRVTSRGIKRGSRGPKTFSGRQKKAGAGADCDSGAFVSGAR